MASTFAWLDYSEADRRKALDIVDLFREQDTRDELGIGTVRDALADALFPGISTIQTRAKYFLFVPWIYQALEESKTKFRDVGRLARKHEIDLIYDLLESEDTNGIIGKEAKSKLQRLPSAVYWSGLYEFGIRRYPGSQDQYHRSLDVYYRGRTRVHASAEDGVVELIKPQANWHDGIPPADQDFPLGATLGLDKKEAEYLRQQIMANVPGTFLAFLVDQGVWWDKANFPWKHPQITECSHTVQSQLEHTRLFSLVMHGAALFYNLMLAEKRVAVNSESASTSDLVKHYHGELEAWLADLGESIQALTQWADDRNEFWKEIHRINQRVPLPTENFINQWIDIALEARSHTALIKSKNARAIIHHREQRLKRGLARLDNVRALEMWSGAAGTSRLSYRWPQVQTIVKDILNGLGKRPG